MSENVKVAVRVRGFNKREIDLGSQLIVKMEGNKTILSHVPNEENPKPEPDRTFAFDYSYWSFDGFNTEKDGYLSPQPGSKYCDQRKIFNDLGVGIISQAFDGFNSSIFAYGQTGSGKSYSIVGYGANKGIVPLLCEQIFKEIKNKQTANPDFQIEVTFSMIEIYNEIVRDLLGIKPGEKNSAKGLPLHEKPGQGFFILEKDLKPTRVFEYANISRLMEIGNANKIIGETKMNATSSRAHTIVELVFKQTFKSETGNMMERRSVIDLIDLAGSERASKTGATGDRFKEGIAINLSLTSLGNVISALATQAGNKSAKIPYRDSTLTKLLMNALGGNSKTVMIAAISPSDYNYNETLSTLRYADRAKQIKCNAVKNEDPKDKLILELQEEINNLKKMVKTGDFTSILNSSSTAEVEAETEGVPRDKKSPSVDLNTKELDKAKKTFEEHARRQIEENEKQMEQLKKTYEQKLNEAVNKNKESHILSAIGAGMHEKALECAHLSNVSVDPMLTGFLKYFFDFGAKHKKFVIGSADKIDIQLNGLGILDKHATVTCEKSKTYFIEPFANARLVRNGKECNGKIQLAHRDRLVFGASVYFVFVDPAASPRGTNGELLPESPVNVDTILQEIAEESGLVTAGLAVDGKPDEIACFNALRDLMQAPSLEEANQMSIVLDKKVKYSAKILLPIVLGDPYSKVQPFIKVRKFGLASEWLWTQSKFFDRMACMSEIYLEMKEYGKVDPKKYDGFDPFCDPVDEPMLIGIAVVEPKCVLHRIPLQSGAKIYDYKKNAVGDMNVELVPCDEQGIAFGNIEKAIIMNPQTDLKSLYYLIRISGVKCLSVRFKRIFFQFKVYGDEEFSKSETGKDDNTLKAHYQRLVSYAKVDEKLINHYSKYPIFFQLFGVQTGNNESRKFTTKEWFERERSSICADTQNDDMIRINKELVDAKTKLKNVQQLLDFAEKLKKERIKIEYVRQCIVSLEPAILAKLKDDDKN